MNTYIPRNFKATELACRHVHAKFGNNIWQLFDPKLLITLDFLRERLGKRIIINNWNVGGIYSERGIRCNICEEIKKYTDKGICFVSQHIQGRAADFNVDGMTAQEVRDWLVKNANELPHPICVENVGNWVHIDTRSKGKKVYLFTP
ncbi:MAG: D-Ala-D-Ala carboxypeptidase family metallohydrolase [Bacteroidales bacterium]